jgi:hypothetical protein
VDGVGPDDELVSVAGAVAQLGLHLPVPLDDAIQRHASTDGRLIYCVA